MKRRKTAVYFIMICLLFGMVGCAQKQEIIYISQEEFFSYAVEVELTTENWKEYFEVAPGHVKESFNRGGTYGYQYTYLMPKELCVISSEQAELLVEGVNFENYELYEIATGELAQELGMKREFHKQISFGDDRSSGKLALMYEDDKQEARFVPFDGGEVIWCTSVMKAEVTEINCIEISGIISSFFIPDVAWNVDEDGVRYLCIGEEENCFRMYEPSFYDDARRYLKKAGKLGGGV